MFARYHFHICLTLDINAIDNVSIPNWLKEIAIRLTIKRWKKELIQKNKHISNRTIKREKTVHLFSVYDLLDTRTLETPTFCVFFVGFHLGRWTQLSARVSTYCHFRVVSSLFVYPSLKAGHQRRWSNQLERRLPGRKVGVLIPAESKQWPTTIYIVAT